MGTTKNALRKISKEVSKPKSVKTRKTVAKKVAKKTKIKKKPVVKNQPPADKTKTLQTLIKAPNLSLAILSPLRFPLDTAKLATQTSRFAGLFLLLIGAILTTVNASYFFTVANQELNASIVESTKNDLVKSFDTDNTKPQPISAVFSLYPSELASTSRVSLVLPEEITAEKIFLEFLHEDTGSYFKLGKMQKNDTASLWNLEFDASIYPEGNYKFLAVAIASGEETQNLFFESDSHRLKNPNFPNHQQETTDHDEPQALTDLRLSTSTASSSQPLENGLAKTDTAAGINSGWEGQIYPSVTISVNSGELLSKITQLQVEVEAAKSVTVFFQRENSGQRIYMGKAQLIDQGYWLYYADVQNLPNARYRFMVDVETDYGVTTTNSGWHQVKNQNARVADKKLSAPTQIYKEIASTYPLNASFVAHELSVKTDPEQKLNQIITGESSTDAPAAAVFQSPEDAKIDPVTALDVSLVLLLEKELASNLLAYAAAKRSYDSGHLTLVEEFIRAKADLLLRSHSKETLVGDTDLLSLSLDNTLKRIDLEIEKVNQIILTRLDTDNLADTDGDGITDYDEVTLFITDPLIGDTDQDGYSDGIEIFSGYDPLLNEPQVAVVKSSLDRDNTADAEKENLTIANLSRIDIASDNAESQRHNWSISGSGVPNSYLNLYIGPDEKFIFIKTDVSGNWFYHHTTEVFKGNDYVQAFTMANDGKIVDQSRYWDFYPELDVSKKGQVNSAALISFTQNHNLLQSTALLALASIALVALGLILIILAYRLREDESSAAS